MAVLWCTHALRRVASSGAAAAPRGVCVGALCSCAHSSPSLKTSFVPVFRCVGRRPLSSAATGAAAAESQRYREVDFAAAAPLAAAPRATEGHSGDVVVSSVPLRSYGWQVRRYRSRRGIAFASLPGHSYTNAVILQEAPPKVSKHFQESNGGPRKVCGSRRSSTVVPRHKTYDKIQYCTSINGNCRSTCCRIGGSSESFSSDKSSRRWDDGNTCLTGKERNISASSNDVTGAGPNSSLCWYAGTTMTSVARTGYSFSVCFPLSFPCQHYSSPFSCPQLSTSPFSCSPFVSSSLSARRPLVSYVLLRRPRQHATQQRSARTPTAALSVSASTPLRVSRARKAWTCEEQRSPNGDPALKRKEPDSLPPQKHEGSCEPSNWDFAEVRRVPPANEGGSAASGRDAGAKGRGEAHEQPEPLTRSTSTSGETSPAEGAARKSPPSVASCSRRVQDAKRRAPPLLRVTDAAAARIQEIVETYNREAALAESREGVAQRNGCRELPKIRSKQSTPGSSSSVGSTIEGVGWRRRAIGIRIGLKKRGCSGLSYTIDVATREGEDRQLAAVSDPNVAAKTSRDRRVTAAAAADEIVETKGGTVVLAGDAIMFLVGTELDFIDTELERKFVFKNPNEKQACGCGKSFTV